jgi:hypothetical protein
LPKTGLKREKKKGNKVNNTLTEKQQLDIDIVHKQIRKDYDKVSREKKENLEKAKKPKVLSVP